MKVVRSANHGRLRCVCKDCKGSCICEHNKVRCICRECKGTSICEHNTRRRNCRYCDPCSYLADIVRNRVNYALHSNKELHSIEYLGCDIATFKIHIESQFEEAMNWNNYGEWHIDHIIPIKYNNPTLEEVAERLHYTNTQPMWANENMSKNNRYIGKFRQEK